MDLTKVPDVCLLCAFVPALCMCACVHMRACVRALVPAVRLCLRACAHAPLRENVHERLGAWAHAERMLSAY